MTIPVVRILLIEDDEEDYFFFKDLLSEIKGQRFIIEWASSFESGRQGILKQEHDIYFLDYRLGAGTGLDLLKEMVSEACTKPMILLTGYGEHEVDLEAMRVGASDYLVKDQVNPP